MPKRYDVEVRNGGSMHLFIPITPEARDWFSNVSTEPWQWMGSSLGIRSLGVDTRFADDLLCGMKSDGLKVRYI